MPVVELPAEWDPTTIVARFASADARAVTGGVVAEPQGVAVLRHTAGKTIILPRKVTGQIIGGQLYNATGDGPFRIFATDDPDVTPNGWVWKIDVTLNGGTAFTYTVPVPVATAAAGVDLFDLVSDGEVAVPVDQAANYVLLSTFTALETRVETLEAAGTGTVDTTGYVSDDELAAALDALTPASIGAQPAGSYATEADLIEAGTGVIREGDARLTDARTPTSHTHPASQVTGLATVATTGSYNDLTDRPASAGSTTVADATTTSKGVVQLAGDLAGTATAPTVPALSTKVNNTDPRLTDARTPTAHTHPASQISDLTAVGRSVVTAASATAARTAIGAGTSNLAIGTTATTAKAGDYTPTKATVGLGNVDNTADTAKPVSTAQAAADEAVRAAAVQRANHTGTQAIATVADLRAELDARARTVTLTQAQYDALSTKDPNTLYVIPEA